jgi:hypothetical protein
MLHPVILTKSQPNGKSTIRRSEVRQITFTSSDQSLNHVPSTDGSGSNPLGKIKRLPCFGRDALSISRRNRTGDGNEIAVHAQMHILDEETFSLWLLPVALLGRRRWQTAARSRLRAVD